jgi:hypothetical protein
MKKFPLFALVLFAAAGWLYFTPYMAVNKLQAAAERGDSEALNDMVDFPALRTSLKGEVQSTVARGISRDNNHFSAIGAAVAGVIVEPMVNAAVTPEGISLLMKGRTPTDNEGDEDSDDGKSWRDDVKIARRYEASDKFVVQYRDRETGDQQMALVMRRDGLRWRLSGVRFGADVEK